MEYIAALNSNKSVRVQAKYAVFHHFLKLQSRHPLRHCHGVAAPAPLTRREYQLTPITHTLTTATTTTTPTTATTATIFRGQIERPRAALPTGAPPERSALQAANLRRQYYFCCEVLS